MQTEGIGAATGAKGAVESFELARWERTVARRAAEIRATVPQLELTAEADARAALAEVERSGISLTALLVRAAALALREQPRANGSYRGDTIDTFARVNVGVTLSGDGFYVIPTVFDADRKSAAEIGGELAELRARAIAGALTPPELAGATFTLSNDGEHGLRSSSPLVIAPQAAALSAGSPSATAATLILTLACDHRILYGALAARFLNSIRTNLEQDTQ